MTNTAPSYKLLEFIAQRVNVGVFVVDRDYRVCYWNDFMAIHSARSAADVVGNNLFETFPDLPVRWFRKKIDSVFVVKSYAFMSWEHRNYLFKFKHNRPITGGVDHMFQNLTLIPIKEEGSSEVGQVLVLVRDSTDEAMYASQLREAMTALERQSQTDALTGLFNRGHWEECLSTEFHRASRYGAIFTLLMVDIDHFKRVNDKYGHLAGDEVIRMVSGVICSEVRRCDLAGRYGGEEFGVILCETSMKGALVLAQRLRKSIADRKVTCNGETLHVTVSIGLAQHSAEMKHYEDVIARADSALYEAKQAGRNRVVVWSPDRVLREGVAHDSE